MNIDARMCLAVIESLMDEGIVWARRIVAS
jgi:hypothetical protein